MTHSSSALKKITDLRPSDHGLFVYLTLVTATYLIWVGLLKLTGPEHQQIEFWLGNSPIFSGVVQALGVPLTGVLMALLEVPAGILVLLGLKDRRLGILGCLMAMLIFALNFLYLFTNPVWMDALGGFPIIGSGQNLLKYLSMFAIPAYILGHHMHTAGKEQTAGSLKKLAMFASFAGIALVMGWIGAMKFYEFEAQGIVRLMQSNILFSWTYQVWDVQALPTSSVSLSGSSYCCCSACHSIASLAVWVSSASPLQHSAPSPSCSPYRVGMRTHSSLSSTAQAYSC